MARPVLTHRPVLTIDAAVRGTEKRDVVETVLEGTEVPAIVE